MSAAAKMNRETVPNEVAEKAIFPEDIAALFLRGMERFAEVQKQCIDLAVQHNADMVDMLKKTTEKMPGAPRMPMLDLAASAASRYADTQKAAIELVVEQGRVWTDTVKDRTSTVKKSTESATNAAKQTMERSFAVQKKALEQTAAHAKAVVDAAKHQFGFTGVQANAMTDTFERGMDTIVEAQKEFLNLVTH
jgi:hypothetical protein